MTNNNNVQENIFSMFGLVDEYEEKKKKEEEERKAAIEKERTARAEELKKKVSEAQSNVKTTQKIEVKKDDFTVNEDTTIRYYGESFEITAYFTSEELAEGILIKKKDGETERKVLEPEMLRKRMEKDFPELVKDHTEMIFIKGKNIVVPTMKAKKKGASLENLRTLLNRDVSFPFPLIPFSILSQFISLAKLYGDANLEIHGDIYLCFQSNKYFLDIPKQRVHKLWTEVTEDSFSIAERIMGSVKVLEIHSHHSMRAIPSLQDDISERVPGMHYAIVGLTHNYFPELCVRQFLSEEKGFLPKKCFDIFECPFQELPTFDMNDIEVKA